MKKELDLKAEMLKAFEQELKSKQKTDIEGGTRLNRDSDRKLCDRAPSDEKKQQQVIKMQVSVSPSDLVNNSEMLDSGCSVPTELNQAPNALTNIETYTKLYNKSIQVS